MGGDFLTNMVLVVVITTFVIPLDIMFGYLIETVEAVYMKNFEAAHDKKLERKIKDESAGDIVEHTDHSESEGIQKARRKAAKLREREQNEKNYNKEVNSDGRYDEDDDAATSIASGYTAFDEEEPPRVFALEMASYDTQSTIMLRAARITKQIETMDDLTAEDEANLLIKRVEDEKMISRLAHVVVQKVKQEGLLKDVQTAYQKFTDYMHGFYLTMEDHGDPIAGAAMLEAERNGHPKLIEHTILKARIRSAAIVDSLDELEGEDEQDAFLLQKFLVESLSGWQRRITNRFFFDDGGDDEGIGKWMGYLYITWTVLYVCFVSLYIFLFGVSLGSEATEAWINGTAMSMVMEIFILQPMRIFISFIFLSSFTTTKVKLMHAALRNRTKGIIKRKKGIMKDSNSLVQHLNPACRAARHYSHLPMSRLLISLNDFDIPIDHLENAGIDTSKWDMKYIQKIIAQFIIIGFIIAFTFLLALPEDIMDGLLDCFSSVFLGIVGGIFYFMSNIHPGVAISFGIGALILFIVYEWKQYEKRQVNKWNLIQPLEPVEDFEDDLSKDVLAVMKPHVKNLKRKTWRALLNNKIQNNFGSYFNKFTPENSPISQMKSSPLKKELEIKLWPELNKNAAGSGNIKNIGDLTGFIPLSQPIEGTSASQQINKKLRREESLQIDNNNSSSSSNTMLMEHVDSINDDIDDLFNDDQYGANLKELLHGHSRSEVISHQHGHGHGHGHTDSTIIVKDIKTGQMKTLPQNETQQQRLARVHPNSKSSVISRSALRNVNKETIEIENSIKIIERNQYLLSTIKTATDKHSHHMKNIAKSFISIGRMGNTGDEMLNNIANAPKISLEDINKTIDDEAEDFDIY